MSGIYLARTNQKLSFTRIHLDRLKQAQDDTSWNKHALIESYNESVLFHMTSAYDAFLREIAEAYSVDTESLDGYRSLAAELEVTGVESPELKQLTQLEVDDTGWLHKLMAAYEACWHGADKQSSITETNSVSEIHVLQVNPDHAEDEAIISEYENWFLALSELIDSLREGMQEW
ncbi:MULTISPECIES: DUF6586 family protein [unclassified Neptuniibacter]|uniref:DUF6586 family protein n=1 Tax=unclassified Neptuniibacter TaxID=2630693 RepID=UPI0025D3BC5A|nr:MULTISPECIES: DUF6586 family protein [unclassified Neptuniibacter]